MNPSEDTPDSHGMIGESRVMQELAGELDDVALIDAPVLITGEIGTGKGVIARAIHSRSKRSDGPLIRLGCGGLPEQVIRSEIFGHESGAFPGAEESRMGGIESAAGGVVVFREIGDLPLSLQDGLLQVLRNKSVTRVGGEQPIPVDVRIVATTHQDLQRAVSQGRFREDLFYRLNVLHLAAPPLREREDDVVVLARAFLQALRRQYATRVEDLSAGAIEAMRQYGWPGNVRELINSLQQAMIVCDHNLIGAADLGIPEYDAAMADGDTKAKTVFGLERETIQSALQSNQQNVSKTARDLGVSRVTLYRLFHKLDIIRPH